jgi:RNA polymerase-interacting CarD/CdnL/TRCF family regulator
MDFQVGDKVIHATYGLGEITHIEEKTVHDHLTKCYVVRTSDLMIWIPINDLDSRTLRMPTSPDEFVKLFDILASPSEKLLDDRMQRKGQLMAQVKDGQLETICRVVRDLTHFKRAGKLNDIEKNILEKVVKSLLTEWTYSLGVPLSQAQQSLTILLENC